MHPILFSIGPINIYSYGVMIVLAVCAVIYFALRRIEKENLAWIKREEVFSLGLWVIIFGTIGARALYILINLEDYLQDPLEILMIQHGGLVFYGGLFAGIGAALIYLKRREMPPGRSLDFFAASLGLGQAIARIGCFLNGCCYGKPTHLFWGAKFPLTSIAGSHFPGQYLHPVQLYASIINLGIFLILWKMGKGEMKFAGQLFFLYLIFYSTKRFFLEFLRANSSPIFLHLTLFQWLSIFIILGTIVLWREGWKKSGSG